ncbi:MAG: tetratricopeptide repeat protein, partial [Candidatus Omnitrophica bacterium]|nr:tetratricopeptide repeat protein [Candidatus Omnitrophota bacterium]
GLMMIMLPVTLRNYMAEKDWIFLSGQLGFNFYLGNNPNNPEGLFYYPVYTRLDQESMFRDARVIANIESGKILKPSEVSRFWFKKALKFILKNPLMYLKILLNKLIHLFGPHEYIHDWEFIGIKQKILIFRVLTLDLNYLMVLFYIGVIIAIKKIKEIYLLYLAFFSFSFSIVLFFVASRYRINLVPFLIIFASFGLLKVVNLFFQKKYLKFLIVLFMILLVSFIFNYVPKRQHVLASDCQLLQYLEKAMYYRDKLDYNSSLKEIESAYRLKPDNPFILNMLGEVYYRLGNLEKAKEMFQKIILKSPLFVDAYYNLGFIYNQEGYLQEAEEMLIKAISLDPEDIQAHFELGRVYKKLGRKDKAKEEFWFVLNQIDLTDTENRKRIEEEFLGLIER